MNTKIALIALTLGAHAAIAAPVPPLPLYESRPPAHRPADPDEGVLVVSLATNSVSLEGVDTLVVSNATSRFRLRSIATAYARDFALFAGVLPEGTYHVHSIEERDAFRTVTLGEADRARLGTFELRRGQGCDLGQLVVTQITLGLAVGRSFTDNHNDAEIARFAPDSAKLLPKLADCWSRPRDEKDIVDAYARIHPAGGAMAVELSDGRVAIPSGMGSVLIRQTDGKWRVARGDGVEQLLFLDELEHPEGSLVAVGELNTIARFGADGRLHRLDAGALPLGNILFIDGNRQNGWHIVHQRGDDLRIYQSASLDDPLWTELAATATGFSAWSGAKQFWVWPTAGGFAYAITDQGTLRFYDYATRSWTERHTPKNNAIIGIAHSPGGVIGVLTSPGGGFGGITASHYISRDAAQTWTEIPKSPYSVKVSAPRMLADGTLLVNGGVFGDSGLQASKDGGNTWVKLSDEISVDDFYWNLPKAGLFNMDKGRDGIEAIAHSGDGGSTWTTEYMNVDRSLLREHLGSIKAAEEQKKADRGKRKRQ